MNYQSIVNNIFDDNVAFNIKAAEVFNYQYANNALFKQWNDYLKPNIAAEDILSSIRFLPISFFKTHQVTTTQFDADTVFESSGTTTLTTSRHYVKDIAVYTRSFTQAFESFYGNISEWCIIGLLPSYLERQHSSLVAMVNNFIKTSGKKESGFYLNEFDTLYQVLQTLEQRKIRTLLIGVTFGLLDFAERYSLALHNTIVMDTGGMKGRRKELTRQEVHAFLKERLGVPAIHSEYGMTELLSQAYAKADGRFYCPPWMKVLVRDEEDPLLVKNAGRGVLNIIDLANINSCSFIATDDAGIVYEDGSFEVIGRVDNSDMRGCSLLVV
jgi:hypothetical protein